jgi:hypothetical protein
MANARFSQRSTPATDGYAGAQFRWNRSENTLTCGSNLVLTIGCDGVSVEFYILVSKTHGAQAVTCLPQLDGQGGHQL